METLDIVLDVIFNLLVIFVLPGVFIAGINVGREIEKERRITRREVRIHKNRLRY